MLKRFLGYYSPYKLLFSLVMGCAFGVTFVELLFPIITKQFINDYIPNKQMHAIITWSITLFILYVVRAAFQYIIAYWGHVVGTKMEADMRSDLFSHLHTLSFKFYDDTKTGQIMSRLVGDLREITELAHHGPENLLLSSVMFIGSFLALISTEWKLTLVLFSVLAILISFALYKRTAMMKTFRSVRKSHAEINAKVENSISGIRLCKTFTNEQYEIEQFQERNRSYQLSYQDAYKHMAQYHAGTKFLIEILLLVVLSIGGYFVYTSVMNYGELVQFLLYATFFVKPIERLVQFTQQFQAGVAGFERFAEMMDMESNITDAPDAIMLKDPEGDILLDNVSFDYGNGQEPVLEGLTLHIPPGRKMALVGTSGVGKTTVAHLIPRFYDVTDGSISIDGKDIREITLRSLRENIGLVQQDTFIFWGTVRENILYGRPSASDGEVITAAKQAKIHDFIKTLPEGYNSLVGERGVKLSGGQKQRIAIARVFLKNPPILILDEATSSLDYTTEVEIKRSLDILATGRTTLIVAHRLSTIKDADEILFMKGDSIAERGTHQMLMDKNGLYAGLYRAQEA
ncbi:ATP-binding cassette domain-containing protein [Candidatus Bathyarchaeota archaeon]|nr:ATP-binding cassette domain-containing protein [Candidatus Bathyarchaeota archaeon]